MHKIDGLFIWFSLENCSFDKWKKRKVCFYLHCVSLSVTCTVLSHTAFSFCRQEDTWYEVFELCLVSCCKDFWSDCASLWNCKLQNKKASPAQVRGFLDFSSCFSIQTHAALSTLIFQSICIFLHYHINNNLTSGICIFFICKRKYRSAYSARLKVPIPQMSTQIAQPVREST